MQPKGLGGSTPDPSFGPTVDPVPVSEACPETTKAPALQELSEEPTSGFEPLTPSLRVPKTSTPKGSVPELESLEVRSSPGFPPQSARLSDVVMT